MTALVTGGGAAIGRGVAMRLATDGHRVAVVDIDPTAAAGTVEAVRAAGGDGIAVQCD